ncbi:amidohydrolase family protein [Virgisporangium ochraceum]|uniref:Amidohydrolase n=1 Tax=Virgisporangium ochraceum TaxID=65505 RepID=A0A8J3ZXT5_9ACTN|nr:amidohydrolase family protein [Virgisporangium ochraceum]GIJ72059.1 amidohydrolase [Virgisporangium ochraceum]
MRVEAPDADARVPAFWQGLGLPGLVDVHVHFLPPRMLRRVWAYFDQVGPLTGIEWPITYKWPDADRVAHLRAMGVRHFTALAYAHKPDMASDLNDWTLDFAAKTEGCVPTATFFPEPTVPTYVDKALESGARIFKVHIQVGDFDPREQVLDPVWGRLAEAGVPAVVHCGSGPAPGTYTGPGRFAEVLKRHPRLRAVIAHLGAPEYREFLELAGTYRNVVLDTTMAFTSFGLNGAPFPTDLLPRLTDLGLAGKVALGTDFPNIPYPYAHQLEALANLGLGDEWLRAVCWTNGAALTRVT